MRNCRPRITSRRLPIGGWAPLLLLVLLILSLAWPVTLVAEEETSEPAPAPAGQSDEQQPAPPVVAPPGRLQIPRLGVDALVEAVGVDETGVMAAPSGPWSVAWYLPGVRPAETGNAVIAGHLDYRGVGPAVFWRLKELLPNDEIIVVDTDGQVRRFVVQSVELFAYDQAPVERIFGETEGANLNLITCSGNFDSASRNYNQRLVVFSSLAQ